MPPTTDSTPILSCPILGCFWPMSGPLQQRSVKLSEPFRIPLCSVLYLKSYTYPCNSQLNSLLCIHNVHNVLSLKRSNSCFFFVQQQLYTVVPVHCTIKCAAGNEATWLGKRWVVWGGEQRRELIHQLPDIAFLMRNALCGRRMLSSCIRRWSCGTAM